MKRNEAFPSKYMTKEDVATPCTFTIDEVIMEEFEGEEGKRAKPIMYFLDEDNAKPMVLNNGNWLTIEGLYGEDSNEWHGKKIELYNDPNVMFGKKRVGGIRVREPQAVKQAPPKLFATVDAALTYAIENGFTVGKPELVAALKATGATGWKPDRDSAWLLTVYLPSLLQNEQAFDLA